MRAAAALLALPAVLTLTAQTPPPHPHPYPSGSTHAHRDVRGGRPAAIIVTGVYVTGSPAPAASSKPAPKPMGNPQVFETHSSSDAR
jgi:hypothetical protein